MRRAVFALSAVGALVLGALLTAPVGSAASGSPAAAVAKDRPKFHNLDPGGLPDLRERVPVQVVLVGYDDRNIKIGKFRDGLAKQYQPIVSSRFDYGIVEKLGITYTYDVDFTDASKSYENRFFNKLKSLSTNAPLTLFQEDYNAQQNNALDVTNNHFIDAPSVERWLAYHPPAGVNTRRNTIYLVNWYDRPDFEFHVYTKMDEPDPDTGYNFGELRESRKVVAWGGTTAADEESGLGSTRRVWFHDISAGPESWAGSWNVDDADIDGDELDDYRIPTIWEYGSFRPAWQLTGDLSKLTRYVALNLLMTSSPAYPVELPVSEPPLTINLDSNTYEGWPGVDASSQYITPRLLRAELQELLTRDRLSYDNQDLPWRGLAKRCFEQALEDVSCFPESGLPAFANFFLQNLLQLGRTKDDGSSVDYELPIFNYAQPDLSEFPLLGFADDNWVDGTQSFVFNFVSQDIVDFGYGLTTTQIHEVGHHVGLSHPHDGYDSATGVDYDPVGDFYFANAGDEVNSIMSYIDLNWDFSQFDQDNMDRFQAAAHIEGANRLAAEALAADQPWRAYDELRAADRFAGRAAHAFSQHQYAWAWALSDRAYKLAREGAAEAGVDVEKVMTKMRASNEAARRANAAHQSEEFIDPLDGPRSLP